MCRPASAGRHIGSRCWTQCSARPNTGFRVWQRPQGVGRGVCAVGPSSRSKRGSRSSRSNGPVHSQARFRPPTAVCRRTPACSRRSIAWRARSSVPSRSCAAVFTLTIGCDGSNSIRRRGPEFRRGLPAYSIQNVCSSATWPASARAPVEGRWTASTNTVYLSSSSPLRQLVNPGDGPVGPAGKGKTHGRQGDGCDSASAEDGQDQGSRPTRVVSRRSSPTSSWPGGGARRRACGRACATSPLSLAPPTSDVKATRGKWARQDSNLRPGDYESLALTN